jgi:hypothetical protein
MNRVFECIVSKRLNQNQAVTMGEKVAGPGRPGVHARAVIGIGAALAVAMLGACSPQQGSWVADVASASASGPNHASSNSNTVGAIAPKA